MSGRFVFSVSFLILLSFAPAPAELPFKQHGCDKQEAAAHLLSRFTYGPRPGEVERVARQGLENWLIRQLEASESETVLGEKLALLPQAYTLDNTGILEIYPRPGQLVRMQ